MVLEVRDTKVVWFVEPVSDPSTIAAKLPEGTDVCLVHPDVVISSDNIDQWELASQKLKKSGTTVVYTAGEFRIKEVHMKGSSLDTIPHYVLQTPEGVVGIFQKEPSDNFIKQYSPLDVVIGRSNAIAGVQLDLEPFYVVLTELSDEYRKKSGISDIKEVDHVSVKKIEASDRDSAVSLSVSALV